MQNRRKIIFWCCVAIFLGCLIFLAVKLVGQEKKKDIYDKMQETNEKLEQEIEKTESDEETVQIPIDFATLQQQNQDIYAWIRIEGTVVDYPIVQHPEDNSYYLNHTVEGKKGLPGSIYTENLNKTDFTDRNTLIYGHDMKNGSMFGDLAKYKDSAYMQEHGQIVIYTAEHIYTYQVFAAITYDNRHIMYSFDFSTEEGMQEFLDSLAAVRNMASYIDKNVAVTSADRMITLSTCTGNESQRLLVGAVLVNEQ